jgi:predicted molibdopterin-dependent oxidoreductase YjgC
MGVEGFDFESADEIFEEVRLATPQYRGMTHERLHKENGLQWPCPTTSHPGTKYLHKGLFPRGRASFVPVEYQPPTETVSQDYPMLLTTGRKLGHYNVTTRFSDLLMEINPFEEAEISPADAERLNLVTHDFVRVRSRRGSVITRVMVTDRVTPGLMFMTFHFPETPTNELTQASYDPVTLTGAYKISAVQVEKLGEEEIRKFTA